MRDVRMSRSYLLNEAAPGPNDIRVTSSKVKPPPLRGATGNGGRAVERRKSKRGF